MMRGFAAWSIVAVALVSGCITGFNTSDTGHCHAEHVATNTADDAATVWSHQAQGSPTYQDHPTARVYTWALHRTDGCLDVVKVTADVWMTANERDCGAINMSAVAVTGSITLTSAIGNATSPLAFDESGSNAIDWHAQGTFHYATDSAADHPLAWNMSVHLIVPHDELELDQFVDKCVQKAVTRVDLEGKDHDFKA